MSVRELVVLGTASQAPTRYRNHNGYVLRWDGAGVLFDPGEGTQRQMVLAGVSVTSLTQICVTHFHGDHCLGLPGVLQRLSLDGVSHRVDVAFPASGRPFFDRLRRASIYDDRADIHAEPVDRPGLVGEIASMATLRGATPSATLRLTARRLDHGPDTFGWRLDEAPGRRMRPDRLEAFGVRGPAVGELQRRGRLSVGGRTVTLEEVSEARPGQSMAFVMDSAPCDGALELAQGVDLLVCESTFSAADVALARHYRHMTATDAGRLASEAGARRLVLTHFSQRYPDAAVLLAEASEHAADVVLASDLMRVEVPRRADTSS